jgi:hypothetical protein
MEMEGDSDGTRTCDSLLRRQVLYPAGVRDHLPPPRMAMFDEPKCSRNVTMLLQISGTTLGDATAERIP